MITTNKVIKRSKCIDLVGPRNTALLNQNILIWFLFFFKINIYIYLLYIKVGHFNEDVSPVKFFLGNSIKEADIMLWRWAYNCCCTKLVDNEYLSFKLGTRKLSEKAQMVLCILLNPYRWHNFILHLQVYTELHGSQAYSTFHVRTTGI